MHLPAADHAKDMTTAMQQYLMCCPDCCQAILQEHLQRPRMVPSFPFFIISSGRVKIPGIHEQAIRLGTLKNLTATQ